MAINLVSLIMQSLTPDMIGRIASMLGLERNLVQKAIGAGVPAILGSFAGLASSPDGARQLSSVLAGQSETLDQVKSAFEGSGQRSLIDSGAGLLSSLFGSAGLNTLANAVSSSVGIDATAGKSILGVLTPLVAGVIGQQQRNQALNANGLSAFLDSQKEQIAAAMPSGVANALDSSGLLGSVVERLHRGSDAVSVAAGTVSGASNDALASGGEAVYAAAERASSWGWGVRLAAIAAVLGIVWYLFDSFDSRKLEREARLPQSTETVGNAAANVSVADLTGQLNSSVGAVKNTLQGIKDSVSAQAALPKLQQATTLFDKLNTLSSRLSPVARQGLASSVAASMPGFNRLCDAALSNPGVAAVAKPTIDSMREKLEALSRA